MRVKCIKTLNPLFIADGSPIFKKGDPFPMEGNIYHCDDWCYWPEWGYYLHLEEFPDPDHYWNADKFIEWPESAAGKAVTVTLTKENHSLSSFAK